MIPRTYRFFMICCSILLATGLVSSGVAHRSGHAELVRYDDGLAAQMAGSPMPIFQQWRHVFLQLSPSRELRHHVNAGIHSLTDQRFKLARLLTSPTMQSASNSSAPEVGRKYLNCKILSFKDDGLFVEVTPGHQGFLHISKISAKLTSMSQAGFNPRQLVDVEVIGEDSETMQPTLSLLPRVGKTYHNCNITSVESYGVFVEVTPGHVFLLHISKLTQNRSVSIDELGLNVGDSIDVKVVRADRKYSKGSFMLTRLPPEVGKTYRDRKITVIEEYGVFVEVTPGHEALLHISALSDKRLESIEDSGLKVGDLIDVKVEMERAKGRIILSRVGVLGATRESPPEVGKTYHDCKIASIRDYGVFVDVIPGHQALLHKSQIAGRSFKVGDSVDVEVERKDAKGHLVLCLASSPSEAFAGS